MVNSNDKKQSRWMSKLSSISTASKIRLSMMWSLVLCIVLINVDFLCHHFGHESAWQSPLYLITVSFEAFIILLGIILSFKKII